MKPVTTAHRRGGRVSYLAELQGPRASWDSVAAAAFRPHEGRAVAAQARIQTREWNEEHQRSELRERSVDEAVGLDVDVLMEVRRPVSYPGMRRYIGRMRVPARGDDGHAAVWFDSRNEQDNYKAIILTHDVVSMATQPMRLVWSFEDGLRSHVPDAILDLGDGSRLLVDVTRRSRLQDDRVKGVFGLTAATAARLGWRYVVRTELTAQHAANLASIWSCWWAPEEKSRAWQHLASDLVGRQVLPAARIAGAEGTPDFAAIWHLISRGIVSCPLEEAIRLDTVLVRGPRWGRMS